MFSSEGEGSSVARGRTPRSGEGSERECDKVSDRNEMETRSDCEGSESNISKGKATSIGDVVPRR